MKGLRRVGAGTLEAANEYLEREFLKDWNERFTVQPDSQVNAHRPMNQALHLESILSHVEQREVTNDYTVAWDGGRWQIPKAAVRPGLRRSSVRVEERLDGTLQTRIGEQFVTLTVCAKAVKCEITSERKRPARRHVPPPGRADGCSTSAWRSRNSLRRKESISPFPFPLRGKAGAGGFPPRRIKRGSPTRGLRPLVHPLPSSERDLGTFYFAGIRNFLLCVDTDIGHGGRRVPRGHPAPALKKIPGHLPVSPVGLQN